MLLTVSRLTVAASAPCHPAGEAKKTASSRLTARLTGADPR